MDNTKICSMCRRVFPIDNFAKNEYFRTEEHKAKSREAAKRKLQLL